jgi:hypothetical protein
MFVFWHRIQMICRRNFFDNRRDLPHGYSAAAPVDPFRYGLAGTLIIVGIQREQYL